MFDRGHLGWPRHFVRSKKPIRVIVPDSPGGSTDIVSRIDER